MRNRWGVEVKKGHWVFANWGRNGTDKIEGRVASIDSRSDFARAYGPQVKLDSGLTVGLDDISQTLGPMKVGKDGTVKQNPLTRIKKGQYTVKPSQATGDTPSRRLVKRRKATAKLPIPGAFANPLTRVKVNSRSQREHFNEETGTYSDRPTKRLKKRRAITETLPAGYYANPSARTIAERRELACEAMHYVVAGNDMFLAMFPHRKVAEEYLSLLQKAHPSLDFFIMPL